MPEQRIELKKRLLERATFSGNFERYGARGAKKFILLKNIRDASGNVVSDHLWFNRTKGLDQHGILNNKDIIIFDARIRKYKRKNGSCDYRLSHPTNIKLAQT